MSVARKRSPRRRKSRADGPALNPRPRTLSPAARNSSTRSRRSKRLVTSLPSVPSDRKRLGAWYTPLSIVRPLVEWAVRRGDTTVLDPATGDGCFLVEAAARLRGLGTDSRPAALYGYDVNPLAVVATRAALRQDHHGLVCGEVRQLDFFQANPPSVAGAETPWVDAVVGNPPYIRYQSFAGEARTLALRRARDRGVLLTRLSSSWAPFVVHATAFLRPGGRLALVLPEELIHASYAKEVRDFLRKTFRTVSLISFENHVFPDSQERVVLLLADGKNQDPAGELRLVSVPDPAGACDLMTVLSRGEVYAPGETPPKWDPGSKDSASDLLDLLSAKHVLTPLASVGKAGIGYVSGANDFFVLSRPEALRRRLTLGLLLPSVTSARQIPGAVLTRGDIVTLQDSGSPCLLWDGRGAHRRAFAAYIQEGIAKGVHRRYKCRVRNPWYRVPGVIVPDAFLTYMSDVIPRLVLNRGRSSCTNTLLAVRLQGIPLRERTAFIAAFYNSATMLSAELIGRRYGGGVLKLEPSEADRVLVPTRQVIGRRSEFAPLLKEIDALLRARRFSDALSLGDRVVLEEGCGLSKRNVASLRESLARRCSARLRTLRPALAQPSCAAEATTAPSATPLERAAQAE